MNASERDVIESLAEVQRLLLPDDPQIRGLVHALHYQPAAIAAGDYYDLMCLNLDAGSDFDPQSHADNWGLMLGDVSGHGPAAAMEAVQFDAILRTYRGGEPPGGPAGALSYANRYFFSRRQRRHFMTAFAARCRSERGLLEFVSAGHPPVLLRRGDSILRLGEDGEIPLGIDRGHRFSNIECAWQPNDMLLAYTDGIIEARDRRGEPFGLERLEHLFATTDAHPQAVRDAVVAALFVHQGGHVGTDDQTLVVLQQLG
jgi:sigma-B regulation protein RsbU (phosphoserine phosphatase)